MIVRVTRRSQWIIVVLSTALALALLVYAGRRRLARALIAAWTNQEFPDADQVRRRIEARLLSTGLSDPALREAYDTLHGMD